MSLPITELRRRPRRGWVAVLAVLTIACSALLVSGAPAHAANVPPVPGQIVHRTYTNAAGTRAYDLYVPTTGGAGRPLMIWLHGCGGPDPLGQGSSLPTAAEEMHFAIAFPIQDPAANVGDCWNWYTAGSMHRGQGEASIIAGITTSVRDELGSDASRVYVGGYSAGGAMTSVMAAAYPDLYAAIAPSAGAPYAFDASGGAAYREMGALAAPKPAWLIQGVLDEISLYPVGRGNLLQWLGTDDYADDGSLNGSVPRLPTSVTYVPAGNGVPAPLALENYRVGNCLLAQFNTSPLDHLADGDFMYYSTGIGIQRLMMQFLLSHHLGDTASC